MLLALILGNVVQLQSRVEIKCSGCELYPNLWDALYPGVASSICFSWASVKTNRGRARARLLPRSSAEVGRRRYLEPITLRSSIAQSRVEQLVHTKETPSLATLGHRHISFFEDIQLSFSYFSPDMSKNGPKS